jgi:hypothetical protein
MNTILISAAAALTLAVQADDPGPRTGPQCGPYLRIAEYLQHGQWAESPFIEGQLSGNGSVMHLFANPQTGTWTIIQQTAAGGCIIGAGVGLRPAPRFSVDKEGGL